jgi:hypothetical protein
MAALQLRKGLAHSDDQTDMVKNLISFEVARSGVDAKSRR